MTGLRHRFLRCILPLVLLFATPLAWAQQRPESPMVAQARELVDTYYGTPSNLTRAAALLEKAYAADPRDAHVFVQAARITIMGGQLTFGRFEPGSWQRYAALLDAAIALDATHPKAHILKAEIFGHQRQRAAQLAALDRAKALGSTDPWLQVGYARYFEAANDTTRAVQAYAQVVQRGPGTAPSERKAYVAALWELTQFLGASDQDRQQRRKYAALALQGRHPADAWTPHRHAEHFLDWQDHDAAILYAREALKTMQFPAGTTTLAAALYAKAASLHAAGAPLDGLRPLLEEARSLEPQPAMLLHYLLTRRGIDGSYRLLEPALRKVMGLPA